MTPDDEPEPLRLRVPTALQVVMALDLAVAVLFLSIAVFAGLHAASYSYEWLTEVGGLLILLVGYAGCGIGISVMLGRASRAARVGQVLWSGLWLACFLGPGEGAGLDGDWGVLSAVPFFLLVAPTLALVLLFTPAVRSFFTTVHEARVPER